MYCNWDLVTNWEYILGVFFPLDWIIVFFKAWEVHDETVFVSVQIHIRKLVSSCFSVCLFRDLGTSTSTTSRSCIKWEWATSRPFLKSWAQRGRIFWLTVWRANPSAAGLPVPCWTTLLSRYDSRITGSHIWWRRDAGFKLNAKIS